MAVCKVSTRLPTALCCNIAVSRYVGRWPWLRVFCNHNCANLFPHNGYTPADSQAHSNHVLVANHYVARTGHCSTSHITHSQTQFWVGSETVYSVIPIAVVMHLLWSIILQIKLYFGYPNGYPNGYSNSTPSIRSHYGTQQVHLYVIFCIFTCSLFIFYIFYFLYFLYLYLFIYLFLQ